MGFFDFFKGKKDKKQEQKPADKKQENQENTDQKWVKFTAPHINSAAHNLPDAPVIHDDVLNKILPKTRHRSAIVSGKKVMMELDGKQFEVPKGSQNYLHGYEDDYGIIFSIDMGEHFSYLTNGKVEELKVNQEEVWKHAGENFLKFFKENVSMGCMDESKDVFTCILDGNQESTIALFPGIINALCEMVGIKEATYACPTVNTFMFWDTERTEEVKERVITYCTDMWNQVPHKHRVSLAANSLFYEAGHIKRAFQVVRDQDLEEFYLPKKTGIKAGHYLVFRGPGGPQSIFFETVILICLATEEQVCGLIINTNTGKPIGELQPDLGSHDFTVEKGGPVSQDQLFFVHEVEQLGTENKVMKDLYFHGDMERLKEMLDNQVIGKAQVRFFNGITVWSKEQLESEINLGAWSVHDAQVDEFMGADSSSLWNILTAADTLTDVEEEPIVWEGMTKVKSGEE